VFGLKNMSGVGISFGIDRIFDVMNELKLFPQVEISLSSTKILFVNFGKDEEQFCLNLISDLRKQNLACELYPDNKKIQKQFEYANKKGIPYVCIIGSNEMQTGKFSLKNLQSGEQALVSKEELIAAVKN
jgi:histidyl-tRNA synthetase